ncbi:MAG: multicomponent Na+:H+ antiporter subunit D [Myxococcota bacterium]
MFVHDVGVTHTLLMWSAVITMVSGVLGAASQTSVRHILSFHIVSQIGFMIMGLALFTPLAIMGAIVYLLHHIVVKCALFLVGGVISRRGQSEALAELGGIWRSRPWLAVLLLLPALSLAGVPPLSGFWAKLAVLRAGVEGDAVVAVVCAIVAGLMTLYSMSKLWAAVAWKDSPTDAAPTPVPAPLLIPAACLVVLSVGIALAAGPIFDLASDAATQLLDRDAYIAAVLGGVQ